MMSNIFVGLDPSAGPSKPSGICLLNETKQIVYIGRWNHQEDICEILTSVSGNPSIIGIDGPLKLPHELDLCCFSEPPSDCGHGQTTPYKGRYCEYLLIKRGYRCFLTSRNSFVKSWIKRCLELHDFLTGYSFKTIEVFPYATRRILFPHIEGKKQSLHFRENLLKTLIDWGIQFQEKTGQYSHDELDAVLAAVTAKLHHQNQTEMIGDARDGYIIIPV